MHQLKILLNPDKSPKMKKFEIFLGALSLLLPATAWSNDDISHSSWMDNLPEHAKVKDISIPGAHDAATSSLNGGATGGKTQTYTIAEQFDRGVRVFDLRPREDMFIYHTYNTQVSMDDVFLTISDKLTENPTEFVIFIIRFERDSPTEAQTAEWEAKMKETVENYGDRIAEFSPSLTVSEARGNIIILSRNHFDSDKAGMLSNWSHWETLEDQLKNFATISLGQVSTKAYIQDKFEYEDVEIKKSAALGLLNWASENADDPAWVINHASGYKPASIFGISIGATTQFETNAENINSYFIDNMPAGRTGMVLMDFAGDNSEFSHLFSDKGSYHGQELVDAIISHNFEYLSPDPEDEIPVGIETVSLDTEKELYTINGVRVNETGVLQPGLYMARQGGKSSKILVK